MPPKNSPRFPKDGQSEGQRSSSRPRPRRPQGSQGRISSTGAPSSAALSALNPGPTSHPAQLQPSASASTPASADPVVAGGEAPPKKKKHRAGKKRRNRRQSFAAPPSDRTESPSMDQQQPRRIEETREDDEDVNLARRDTFYRLGQAQGRSNTSLDSEALLDHRDSAPLRTRRQSIQQGLSSGRPSYGSNRGSSHRAAGTPPFISQRTPSNRLENITYDDSDEEAVDDHTPLIASSHRERPVSSGRRPSQGYGGIAPMSAGGLGFHSQRARRPSNGSSRSSRRGQSSLMVQGPANQLGEDYDVNNPPSVPGSPEMGPSMGYDDVMLTGDLTHGKAPEIKRTNNNSRDALIDIDENGINHAFRSTPPSPSTEFGPNWRGKPSAEDDVCFPQDGLSEIAEEEQHPEKKHHSRRRSRFWPDLRVLEDWAVEEKEERAMDGIRAKKISEPVLVGGRLRPKNKAWHLDYEDAPYRFTYFNEEFESTIHSQTISELVQPGQTFGDLFIPEPPELDDSSSEDDEDDSEMHKHGHHSRHDHHLNMHGNGNGRHDDDRRSSTPVNGQQHSETRHSSAPADRKSEKTSSGEATASNTPQRHQSKAPKPKRYGPRPVFWLDVLQPTDAEMRVLSKTFGIHPLTAEDIMMQEAREKVELFRNYYFVNYRTFEQDKDSEDYLEPINMYVVVFREGVISFHFSMTPHPANVRRRIRQLSDYLILSSDWISYAIIDDITDVYAPLIQHIEDEVDRIDDDILQLHAPEENSDGKPRTKAKDKELEYEKMEKEKGGDPTSADNGGDMLRRVGECRKKVMSLYRLLGNKADVIKGFAKRCNEQWEVAPRSEIGLYLGDIQDHIVTMTGNLSHYENLLSRAHSNYLAQINIRMNERQEQTSDILGKLTVLGTIVLPMNIVTGMWGMNVMVPGQEVENLWWFFGITMGLLAFGLGSYFIAKRVYGIV